MLSPTNQWAAPPGPPQTFFFEFEVTNYPDGVLFEMYQLSGNADLVLQRDLPPALAPYFAGSYRTGLHPEQIVVRTSYELPDLTGKWYLGIINNESNNVAYTLRAYQQAIAGDVLTNFTGFMVHYQTLPSPHGVMLSWHSVLGEHYVVQYSPSLANGSSWRDLALITATTPISTFEVVPLPLNNEGYWRISQVPAWYISHALLQEDILIDEGLVRLYWSVDFPNETLQWSANGLYGPWYPVGLPVTIEGNYFVVYDPLVPPAKTYRLIP